MVSSDPDIADETAVLHGAIPYEALDGPAPTDELRERMRLRLAKSRAVGEPPIRTLPGSGGAVQPSTWPLSAGSGLPIIAGGRAHGEVGQLVWNSVLDSLATGTTNAIDPVPTPPGLTSLAPLAHQSSAPTLLPLPSHPVVAPVDIAPVDIAPVEVAPVAAQPSAAPVAADDIAPAFIGATHHEPAWIVPTEYGPAVVDPTPGQGMPAVAPTLPPILITEAALPAPPSAAETDPLPLADHVPIVPAMPVLAPRSRAAPPPRPLPAVLGDELPAPATAAERKKVSKRAAKNGTQPVTMSSYAQRHKERHPVRSFLSFVLVLALLGAAGYAGWYKFLRNNVTWTEELQPTADFVESAVHRSFAENVTVRTLSAPEYEVSLGVDALTRLDPTGDLIAFRAAGLVDGPASAAEIGHILAPTNAAFYSATDHAIYRLEGTSAAMEVGLIRAMTTAIVDQDIALSTTLATLTPSQRTGLRAMIDGAANLVVRAKYLAVPDLEAAVADDEAARFALAGVDPAQLPFYLSGVLGSVEVGSTRFAQATTADPLHGLAPPQSDAVVFDPALGARPGPTPVAAVAPAQGLGVEFWYTAMEPSLGPDAARDAALRWTGDTTTTSVVNGQPCLSSTIMTAGPEDQASLQGALTGWAASRPPSSNAAVTAATDGTPAVTIRMCAPAEGGAPVPGASIDTMRTFFERAETEHAVVQRIAQLGAGASPTAAAVDIRCVVAAARNGAIADFDPVSTDPQLVAALRNVAAFCAAG